MDALSLADLFWAVLVAAGVTAEVLERGARRRRPRPSSDVTPAPAAATSAVPASR